MKKFLIHKYLTVGPKNFRRLVDLLKPEGIPPDPYEALSSQLTDLGCVAFWPLTSDADDIIGTAHGVVNGATIGTELVAGAGGAYSFDGVDDHIDIGAFDATSLAANQISIEATIHYTGDASTFDSVISLLNASSIQIAGMGFGTVTANRIHAYIVNNQRYENATFVNTTAHVVMTWVDGNNPKIYVDGVEVTTDGGHTSFPAYTVTDSAKHRIGHTHPDNTGNDSNYRFNGRISHVGVYNRELTADEVQTRYLHREGMTAFQQHLSDLGAVAYWPMTETSGTVVEDVIGGYNGTAVGATPGGTELVSGAGAAWTFDGVDDYIDISALDELALDVNQRSIEVTFTSASDGFGERGLLQLGRSASPNYMTTLQADDNASPTSDVLSSNRTGTAVGAGSIDTIGGSTQDFTQATHAVMTWAHKSVVGNDGGRWRLYIDGVLEKEVLPSSDTTSFGSPYPSENANNHYIGDQPVFGSSRNWNGRISHVVIYNSELTPQQVVERYENRTSVPTPNPFADYLRDLGAVAFWPLNEGEGTVAEDIIGVADGTYVGATHGTELVSGAGSAASFDGTDDYIDISAFDEQAMPNDKFSYEFTLNATDVSVFRHVLYISRQGDTTDLFQARLGQNPGDSLQAYSVNDFHQINYSAGTFINVTRHFVVTWSTASGNLTIYEDGVQVGQLTGATTTDAIGAESVVHHIGRKTTFSYFQGRISHVGIYDRELTAAEVSERYHFRDTAPTAFQQSLLALGAVSFWPLDEGEGTTATDIIGGADGTLNGATWGTELVTGAGSAASFDGVDDYISVTTFDGASLPVDEHSIEATIRFDDTGPTENYGVVTLRADGGSNQSRLRSYNTTGGQGSVLMDVKRVSGNELAYFDIALEGTVLHLVGTYSSTNGSRIYVDGVLQHTSAVETGNPVAFADLLYIGSRTSTTDKFKGRISHVAIYNRELTADEVADRYVYRSGSGNYINQLSLGVERKALGITVNPSNGYVYSVTGDAPVTAGYSQGYTITEYDQYLNVLRCVSYHETGSSGQHMNPRALLYDETTDKLFIVGRYDKQNATGDWEVFVTKFNPNTMTAETTRSVGTGSTSDIFYGNDARLSGSNIDIVGQTSNNPPGQGSQLFDCRYGISSETFSGMNVIGITNEEYSSEVFHGIAKDQEATKVGYQGNSGLWRTSSGTRVYEYGYQVQFQSVAMDLSGNAFAAGFSREVAGENRATLVKFVESTGSHTKSIRVLNNVDNNLNTSFTDIHRLKNGNFVGVGYVRYFDSQSAEANAAFIAEFDSNLDLVAARTIKDSSEKSFLFDKVHVNLNNGNIYAQGRCTNHLDNTTVDSIVMMLGDNVGDIGTGFISDDFSSRYEVEIPSLNIEDITGSVTVRTPTSSGNSPSYTQGSVSSRTKITESPTTYYGELPE